MHLKEDKKTVDLLVRVRSQSQQAFAELALAYAPLIESECAKRVGKIEADELRQVALIGLYSAACSFDITKEGITFGLYAKICIGRRLDGELRKLYTRVEEPIGDDEISPVASPEEELIARESYNKLLEQIDRTLTEGERSAFMLYLSRKSYAEIANILGRTEKSVDGAIRRAKAKLRKING